MEFTGSNEDHEKRTSWMEKRTKERFKKRLKCEDVYDRSRSSSPDPYRELIENYRKSQENKNVETDLDDIDDKGNINNNEKNENNDKNNLNSEETDVYPHKRKLDQDSSPPEQKSPSESDSDEEYGPKPLKINPALERKMNYGAELLPGEGDAIAQFIKEGKRIPRRGEVGMTSEQIENFERIGYVMSGSRHKSINAMRIKKESMVLTAEQERAKALEKYQARINRENEIVNNFREMLRKKYEEEENVENNNRNNR